MVLAALLLLAVLAAWQVPGRLDWNRYRATIEVLASSTLGRPVTIAGPITLSLLPETELTAADVVVGGSSKEDGNAAPALTVKALRLRVAPLPLLAGRVDARELALSGPDLSVAWPLRPGELAGWPPYWLTAFSARIEKGRLRLGGMVLDGVEATLETTDTGGLVSAGKGQLGGQPVRFTARLTAAGADGVSGLNLTVEALDRLAGVKGGFAGRLAADGGLTGQVDLSGPDLPVLLAAKPVAGGGAFRLRSALKTAGNTASFEDLTIDLTGPNGPAAVHGTADLILDAGPRLDAKLSAARLDFGIWMPLLGQAGNGGLTVGLELKAEALAFGGGLMRQVSASLELTPARVLLRDLTAQLPGGADLAVSGTVQRDDPAKPRFDGPAKPRFDGNVRVAAPRLRETLRWLDSAGIRLLPDLPEPVLASAVFRAHAILEPGALALDRIEGRLDGVAMNGEARFRPRSGNGVPAVTASLELASLELDPWLPDNLAPLADPVRGLEIDLRVRALVAHLRGQEIQGLSLDAAMQPAPPPPPAGPAASGAVSSGGKLTLRQLEATVRGVHLSASGILSDGGRLSDGRLQATTPDASILADLVPPAWRPADGFWRGPASLTAQFSGPMDALGLKLGLEMADARLEALPVIDLRGGKWAGPLTLRHPGATRFLAVLGLPGADGWLGEGSLSVIAQFAVQPNAGGRNRISLDLSDLTAGQMRLSASLVMQPSGEGDNLPSLSGRVQADTLAFPAPSWWNGNPLPFAGLLGWRANVPLTARQVLIGQMQMLTQTAGTLTLADGVLRLDPFSAGLAGGTLTGTLAVNAAAETPVIAARAVLAAVNAAELADPADPANPRLGLLAGRVNAALDITTTGHSPAAMQATSSGTLALDAADGVVSGFDLFRVTRAVVTADPRGRPAAEAALRAALTEGVTSFDQLAIRAEVRNGTWTVQDGTFAGTAGAGTVSGSVSPAAQSMDLRVALRPAIEAPPDIVVRLTGPWQKPRQSPELAGFLRWLAEKPANVAKP